MRRIVGPPVRSGSHELDDGWLSVERSMFDRIDRYETENHHVFPGGWLEVRKYSETGQTLGRYIDSVMLERAKALLMAGASVRDVAVSIGYATSSGFTSAFRRATGLLPSEITAISKSGAFSRQGASAEDTGAKLS